MDAGVSEPGPGNGNTRPRSGQHSQPIEPGAGLDHAAGDRHGDAEAARGWVRVTVKYAGLLLRAAREQAGVKVWEMAEAAGHCHRDLSRMELGARGWRVTPEVVKVYEEVLDMPLAEAVARLTGPDPISSRASGPVSGPGLGCALATADAFELVAEPLRRLVETVHMLVGELRLLRGDGLEHDRVNGKVDVSGGV